MDGTYLNSWSKIWHYVAQITDTTRIPANNRPVAIYFIDEPELNVALKSNGEYQRYSYSGFVCTLRQALDSRAETRDIKIFTALSTSVNSASDIVLDIKNQMPEAGCDAGTRSMPDWIAINNYFWTDAQSIHSKYSSVFGGSNDINWILFPPTTQEKTLDEAEALLVWTNDSPRPIPTDQDLKDRLQAYWDYLVFYPNDPVIAIIYFKFDKVITNNNLVGQGAYSMSRDLINHMANRVLGL